MAAVACNVANLIAGYYFIRKTSYGWFGAAIARSIGNAVAVPTILICMFWKGWRSAESSSTYFSVTNRKKIRVYGSSSVDDANDDWGTQQYLEIGGCRKFSFTKGDEVMNIRSRTRETEAEFLLHVYEGFVSWNEALSANAIVDFLRLGLPGMLQVMFEWYVSAIHFD